MRRFVAMILSKINGSFGFALLLVSAGLIPLLIAPSAYGDTEVSGNQSGTWTQVNSPYIVTSRVTVPVDEILVIEPGVVVKVDDKDSIDVRGTLNAVGTAAAKITFTANGVFSPGGWGCVSFADGGGGTLDWCVIEYAGYWDKAGILCHGDASPTISNCEITNIGGNGIKLWLTSSPSINDCTISQNEECGIEMNDSASPTLENNTITDNDAPARIKSGACVPSFTGNTMTGNRTYDGIIYTGSIPDNITVTWSPVSVPYVVDAWFNIGQGATLNIPAGAVLKFGEKRGMNVYGTLNAVGTSAQNIIFTGLTDDGTDGQDTNRDGTATTPEGDYWQNVEFHDGSSGVLDWCVIRYGGHAEDCNIICSGNTAPTISNTEIAYSGSNGIRLRNDAHAIISDCAIVHNTEYGVRLRDNAYPTLENNTITENSAPVYLFSGTAVPVFTNNTMTGNMDIDGIVLGTTIPDNVTITWNAASVPYVINNLFSVGKGATLNIPAGTVVKSDEKRFIYIYGTLNAVGTSTQKIVFTALTDDDVDGRDTNRDGATTTPEPGYWNGVQFWDEGGGTLDWCVVTYSGQSSGCNIFCRGSASPTISNCEIAYASNQGIKLQDTACPSISGCTIAHNGEYGVELKGSACPTISDSTITDNSAPVWTNSGLAVPTFTSNIMTGNRDRDGIVYRGSIPNDTAITWDAASVPYVIETSMTIGLGATLNIPAGTVVKFDKQLGINVRGTLNAVGTSMKPIIFTALTDDDTDNRDTNCDGTTTTPVPGYWGSIGFRGGSSGTLDHCIIKYGGYWENGMVVCYDGASPAISNSQISRVTGDGVVIYDTSAPVISPNNILTGASGYCVNNKGSAIVNARNNWWGHESGPYHETKNPAGQGCPVSDNVDFSPYLTNPPTKPMEMTLTVEAIPVLLPTDGKSTARIVATVTGATDSPKAPPLMQVSKPHSPADKSLEVDFEAQMEDGSSGTGGDSGGDDDEGTLIYTGSTRPYEEDDEGKIVTVTVTVLELSESVEITLIPAVAETAKKLVIPEVAAGPGDTITVPINVDDASRIAGADMVIVYDREMLTAVDATETALSSGMNLTVNINTSGVVNLIIAGVEGIAGGSGSLIDMVFAVSATAEAGAEAPIGFKTVGAYDVNGNDITVTTQDGKVTIGPACVKGDVNGNGSVNSGDVVLLLRIAAGLVTPTPTQECAADMNGDGRINSADAVMLLRTIAGLSAPGAGLSTGIGRHATLTLDKAYGVTGESVIVSLRVDSIDGLAGGDISIAYSSAVLRAVRVSFDSGILSVSNVSEPGLVQIAFAAADALNSKTVAEIEFDVLTDNVSTLEMVSAELYRSDALPMDLRLVNSEFRSRAMPVEHTALLQNFPNPFNPETWIPYQLEKDADVTIRIYAATGNLVRTLYLGHQRDGFYKTKEKAAYWNGANESGENAASGVYFYTIRAGDFTATRKMLIAK